MTGRVTRAQAVWTNNLGEEVKSEVYADFIDQWGNRWLVVKYWRTAEPWLVQWADVQWTDTVAQVA